MMSDRSANPNPNPICLVEICDRLEKVRSQLLIAQISFQSDAYPPGIGSALGHFCEGIDIDLAEIERANYAMLEAERAAINEE